MQSFLLFYFKLFYNLKLLRDNYTFITIVKWTLTLMIKNNHNRNSQVMLKNNLKKLAKVNRKKLEKGKQLKSLNKNKKNKRNKLKRKNLLNQKTRVLIFKKICKLSDNIYKSKIDHTIYLTFSIIFMVVLKSQLYKLSLIN